MTDYKRGSLKEARRLVKKLEAHYNDIDYFHRLIELAGNLEDANDIRLILDAYLPIGKSRLDEMGQFLVFLKEAIKVK